MPSRAEAFRPDQQGDAGVPGRCWRRSRASSSSCMRRRASSWPTRPISWSGALALPRARGDGGLGRSDHRPCGLPVIRSVRLRAGDGRRFSASEGPAAAPGSASPPPCVWAAPFRGRAAQLIIHARGPDTARAACRRPGWFTAGRRCVTFRRRAWRSLSRGGFSGSVRATPRGWMRACGREGRLIITHPCAIPHRRQDCRVSRPARSRQIPGPRRLAVR